MASEQDKARSKLRPIEIAIDSFESRMQSSFSSRLSNLKNRLEHINSRLTQIAAKDCTPQAGSENIRSVVEEIKSFVHKDMQQDLVEVIGEKLVEFQGLILAVKKIIDESALASTQPSRLQQEAFPQNFTSSTMDSTTLSAEKDREIASLREEINRLYNLTEREPRFQPFWILRDAYPSSLQITKIARTMNATPADVHENLKTFERLGLVEINKGEARATKLVRPNKPSLDR